MPLFQLTNSSANPRDPQFTARRTRRGAMAASAIWEVVGGAEWLGGAARRVEENGLPQDVSPHLLEQKWRGDGGM